MLKKSNIYEILIIISIVSNHISTQRITTEVQQKRSQVGPILSKQGNQPSARRFFSVKAFINLKSTTEVSSKTTALIPQTPEITFKPGIPITECVFSASIGILSCHGAGKTFECDATVTLASLNNQYFGLALFPDSVAPKSEWSFNNVLTKGFNDTTTTTTAPEFVMKYRIIPVGLNNNGWTSGKLDNGQYSALYSIGEESGLMVKKSVCFENMVRI